MLTKEDIQQIKELLEPIQKEVNRIGGIEKRLEKIEKNVDTIVSFFDRENVNLRKRVQRIEEHLNLPEYFE